MLPRMKPLLFKTPEEFRSWRASISSSQKLAQKLGFVPTLGALHEGHLSLVRMARKKCDRVVVSIFVNPLQFGPGEDFEKYPRPLENDLKLLEQVGVDAVFAPEIKSFYSDNHSTFVVEEKLSQGLCGAHRPGHFRGVTTVVLKLLNLIQPQIAFFGQKDAQQVAVVKKMVHDLLVPVEIAVGPTIREPDGLALSSRNAYLKPELRKKASKIFEGLQEALNLWNSGENSAKKIALAFQKTLLGDPDFQIQYCEVVDPEDLHPLEFITSEKDALIAVAVYLGSTRLVDNLLVSVYFSCP